VDVPQGFEFGRRLIIDLEFSHLMQVPANPPDRPSFIFFTGRPNVDAHIHLNPHQPTPYGSILRTPLHPTLYAHTHGSGPIDPVEPQCSTQLVRMPCCQQQPFEGDRPCALTL
jgi:hypothetical protein